MKIKLSKLFSLPFLVLLIISSILWLTGRLSHSYTAQIEIPIKIVTDFDSEVWIEQGLRDVRCVATGSGRQLLSYKMGFVPAISVPMSLLTLKEKRHSGDPYIYTIGELSLEKALAQVLNNVTVNMIIDTMPSIKVARMINKRIRVEPRENIVCTQGYMLASSVYLSVDSIDVKAPKAVLDTLTVIHTKPIQIHNLHSTESGSVGLDIPPHVVTDNRIKVRYEVRAVPYSEKVYTVPIEVVGHPNAITLPSRAVVRLRVPLATYPKTTAPTVSINPSRENLSNHYQLIVSELNHGASVVSVSPSMVQYLIEK